jgi:hypothetical protein
VEYCCTFREFPATISGLSDLLLGMRTHEWQDGTLKCAACPHTHVTAGQGDVAKHANVDAGHLLVQLTRQAVP